jgi:hypothetical protein
MSWAILLIPLPVRAPLGVSNDALPLLSGHLHGGAPLCVPVSNAGEPLAYRFQSLDVAVVVSSEIAPASRSFCPRRETQAGHIRSPEEHLPVLGCQAHFKGLGFARTRRVPTIQPHVDGIL